MISFVDLQKEYTGDGEKSCLTLTIPVEEQMKHYQIGMLEKNHLNLLLPLVVQRVNDEWKLSYDITSKIPLSRVLERKPLQHHEFEFIIRQFSEVVHDLKEYLLDLPSVVFDKNYIYCDPAELTLYFVYLPVNTSEKEPERIKSFLIKLIVEEIRLVEDISGALLKKLLEALKSEAFTSELLNQCMNSAGINLRQSSQKASGENDAAAHLTGDDESHNASIPGAQTEVPFKADKAPAKGKYDGNRNLSGQMDYPSYRSHSEDHRPSPPGRPKNAPHEGQMHKGNNQSMGISLILQKYPKSSWFIAGGVNLLLIGVLAAIIAASVKNPGNAVGNIAGFLLIAAAGNYFLFTRLFSKEKINPVQSRSDTPAGNTPFKKRFVNENADEDIILPKNPAVRFRGEMNREKTELPSGSQISIPFSPNRAVFGDLGATQESSLRDDGNRENGGNLNQKTGDTGTDHNRYSNSGVQTELKQAYPQAFQTQRHDQEPTVQGIIGNSNPGNKNVEVQKDNIPPTLENIIEPVRPQVYSDKRQSANHAPDGKQERNQSFPDKTMVLGKPSQQIPSLVSLTRPYERILLEKTPLLIGRLADSVDFVIQNRAIGKIHAEIKKVGEHYFIIDLNSVNGTYVNGERLICNTETPMNNGDKITLANESYTFTA